MTKTLLPCLLIALLSCMGCGGDGGGATEPDLTGTWTLDYQELANQIMGPKMGPNYYKQMFSRLTCNVVFKEDGTVELHHGSHGNSGSASQKKAGTWKITSPGRRILDLHLDLEGKSEDIAVEFVDGDTIQMKGPPKMLSTAPVKYVQLSRKK